MPSSASPLPPPLWPVGKEWGALYCSPSSFVLNDLPKPVPGSWNRSQQEKSRGGLGLQSSISFFIQRNRNKKWISAPDQSHTNCRSVSFSSSWFNPEHILGLTWARNGSEYTVWIWPTRVVVWEVSCMAMNHAAADGQCLLPESSNLLVESELPKVTHICVSGRCSELIW